MRTALVVDRVTDWRTLLNAYLKKSFNCESKAVATIEEATAALLSSSFDLFILADPVNIFSVNDLAQTARINSPNIRVILHVEDLSVIKAKNFPVVRKANIKKLLEEIERQTQWPIIRGPSNDEEA